MRKLFVLDIDNTLTQSVQQHQTAFLNSMLDMQLKDIDTNWNTYLHHTDRFIFKSNFCKNSTTTFNDHIIREFEQKMCAQMLSLPPCKEVPGAIDFIELAKSKECAVAFATGSLLAPAVIKLDQAQIPYISSLIIGSNKLDERESIVTKAIEAAKKHYKCSEFDQIVSFGDGIWDLQTAQNLTLDFVGIGNKHATSFIKAKVPFYMDWKELILHSQEPLIFG